MCIIILILLLGVVSGYYYYKYVYPYSRNAPAFSERDLVCGAYYGDYNQKKPGTPVNWKWSYAGRSSGWYDPENPNRSPMCEYEPPIVGGCAGVSSDNLQECCDNLNLVHVECVGEWEIKDNQCSWKCGGQQTSDTSSLQNCSGGEYSTDCPEDYHCYEHLTGGNTPYGALPIEPYGGDSKCHKKCVNDIDCPEETPYCILKKIQFEDVIEAEYLCFSEEEGKKQREEKYQECVERIRDLEANQPVGVSFSQYLSPNDDPEKILSEDYGFRVKKWDDEYMIISDAEDPIDDICKVQADNRFHVEIKLSMNVTF